MGNHIGFHDDTIHMKQIGMLTIGQSPRDDLIPGVMEILGEDFEIVQAGALDDLSYEEIQEIELNSEHYILVSRMRDGREIKITKKFVVPRMQEQLDKIEAQGVKLTVVMCTGKFPQFESKGLVVTPSEILRGVVEGSLKAGKLAVVYPTREQIVYAERDFGREDVEIYADSVSPYEPEDVEGLLKRLKAETPDLIFLNCFGFPSELKQRIVETTGKPVIHSSGLIARVLKELI
jgi:protein AroM